MRILLYIVFLQVCFVACSNKSQPTDPDKQYSDSLWNVISGKWRGETGGAVFEIRRDSIKYGEDEKLYPCWLKKDTFSYKFPDRDTVTVFGRMEVSGQTLKIVSWWDDGSKYTTFA
jgi:hypothetical protein